VVVAKLLPFEACVSERSHGACAFTDAFVCVHDACARRSAKQGGRMSVVKKVRDDNMRFVCVVIYVVKVDTITVV
jgi:hypothetical protein